MFCLTAKPVLWTVRRRNIDDNHRNRTTLPITIDYYFLFWLQADCDLTAKHRVLEWHYCAYMCDYTSSVHHRHRVFFITCSFVCRLWLDDLDGKWKLTTDVQCMDTTTIPRCIVDKALHTRASIDKCRLSRHIVYAISYSWDSSWQCYWIVSPWHILQIPRASGIFVNHCVPLRLLLLELFHRFSRTAQQFFVNLITPEIC